MKKKRSLKQIDKIGGGVKEKKKKFEVTED